MKKILVLLIKGYRKFISPYKTPCCRFTPTCSKYAIEALEKYGIFKGGWMAFCRLMRCNPFSGRSGYDPVK